jgi:hypothetical protein
MEIVEHGTSLPMANESDAIRINILIEESHGAEAL